MDGRRHPALRLVGYLVGYLLGNVIAFALSFLVAWVALGRRFHSRALELVDSLADISPGIGLDTRSGRDECSHQELPQEQA